jgi:hypothetical protein
MNIPQELVVEPEKKNGKWPKKDDDGQLSFDFWEE